MKANRHRRKVKHIVMITSNRIDDKVHQHSLSSIVAFLVALILIFCIGTAAFCFYLDSELVSKSQNDVTAMKEQMHDLSQNNVQLNADNSELMEQNAILKETLGEKIKAEEEYQAREAARYIPNGLPASGVVSMTEQGTTVQNVQVDPSQNTDGENVITEAEADQIITAQSNTPMVIFGLKDGSSIMATADGTVITVDKDSEYTNVVRIDHGNGYVTVYRCSLTVRVTVGDFVEQGDPIFAESSSNNNLCYQILYNAEYINPFDVMELKG